jgi:hypothetical protein
MGGVPAGASAPWQWVHQLGSYYTDVGLGVAADTAGNVYVTGFTYATLPGAPETNDADGEPGVPFIAKYDTSGTKLWVHQFGPGTVGFGVAVDGSGNAYVATDAGVVKFDTSGTELWFQSIATSGATYTRGVAVDGSGSAYVTGSTRGTLPGSPETNAGFADVFVAKYDTSGTKLWVHQLG